MKTDYDHPDSLVPHPLAGDKIQFKRIFGAYKHVGIADGKGGIYHFSGELEGGLEINMKSKAYWKHDKIEDVAKVIAFASTILKIMRENHLNREK